MQTILRGKTGEVRIDTEGPMIIVGEKINPTGHKRLQEALKENSFDYIFELARKQEQVGADVLDVNVGVPGADEVKLLCDVVKALAEHVTIPFCLDSNNPRALEAALSVTPGKPLVNSVNGEEASLRAILPIIKEHRAAVIGLTMDDNGIPQDAETRVAIAGKILERAAKIGIPAEDVLIDPLVLTVGADTNAATVTLRTIELVRKEFGVSINLGASNVSFGLPNRLLINQSFVALAAGAGANCMIVDPLKLAASIRATDLLRGRDQYAKRYITITRKLQSLKE